MHRTILLPLFVLIAGCGSSPAGSSGGGSDSGSGSDTGQDVGAQQCPASSEPYGACPVDGQTCGPYFGCATCICDQGTWNCTGGSCDAGSQDAAGDARDGAAESSSGGDGATAFCPVACDPATSFCEASYGPPGPDGGEAPSYFCEPFASPCDAGGPSCACATVGPFCTCADDGGDVTVTCPFHP